MNCIPYFKFGSNSMNTTIDNVNYADIIVNNNGEKVETEPELPC